MPGYDLTQIDVDHYRVEFVTQQDQRRWITIKNHDFHAMGKRQLGEIIASAS